MNGLTGVLVLMVLTGSDGVDRIGIVYKKLALHSPKCSFSP